MMNIEKGKISNSQFLFLIFGYIEGSTFVLGFISNLARHDIWLTVLSALAVIVPFVYMYALLAKQFPDTNFARINRMIYGRYLGTIISLLYLGYFFLILSERVKEEGDFFSVFFMRETPLEAFIIVFTGVCAYAVWNGVEVLARITLLIVTYVSLSITVIAIMLLPKMNFSNFLPLGEVTFINLIHSTHILDVVLFGEMIVFLPFTFALNNSKRMEKTFLSGLFLATAFFMITVVRNTAVLGNTESVLLAPSFQVVRLINFGFLSRLDILLAMGHTVWLFLKCSVAFYSTVLFFSQIFELRTYKPMIFPLGCIAIILGIILYPSPTARVESVQNDLIFVISPLIFIVPPLSLLIAKIRKLPKKDCL